MQHGRQWVSNIQRAGRRYRFQVGGLPDRDGTTTRWHSFDTQEEAEKARRQVLAGIRRLQQAAEALTWAEAIDQYCTARAEECRALSIDTLRGRLRRFFHDALQPAKLTADQAQALYNTLRPKVSVQEHRHCLSRARALGAWLVSQGMWKDNPLLLRQAERARRRPTKPQGEVVTISPPLWGRDRWWVHREVTRCCKAAGVPLVPPHGLRGTWASLARAVATAPVAVAATLGQAGTEVQERHYARPDAIAAGHQVAVLQVIRGGTR
jgi:integrase